MVKKITIIVGILLGVFVILLIISPGGTGSKITATGKVVNINTSDFPTLGFNVDFSWRHPFEPRHFEIDVSQVDYNKFQMSSNQVLPISAGDKLKVSYEIVDVVSFGKWGVVGHIIDYQKI